MAVVDSGLLEQCKRAPDEAQSVVITLRKGKEMTPISALGLENAESIGEGSGLIKATLAGGSIMQLAEHPDVEAVEPDAEFGALAVR
jgi:hypothetical protein